MNNLVCQTPQGSDLPAGILQLALCPNIPSAALSTLLPAGLWEAGGATTPSLWHTQVLGSQPQHTGCLACQLGTLAKTPCLEPGLSPPFLLLVKESGQE